MKFDEKRRSSNGFGNLFGGNTFFCFVNLINYGSSMYYGLINCIEGRIEHRIEHRIDGKRCKLTIIIENQLTFLFLYRY